MRDVFPVRPQPVKDWQKLQAVYEMARHAGVSFALEYVEPDDLWYFVVHSASREEEFMGCNRSFDEAYSRVSAWLGRLACLTEMRAKP